MTISSLFIRRPRLAFVVSTVITIAGLHRHDRAAGRAVPRHRAAAGPRHRHLSRRLGPGGRGERGPGHRRPGQRRRAHDLHEVDLGRRRQLCADRQLRGRLRTPTSTPSTSPTASTRCWRCCRPRCSGWASRPRSSPRRCCRSSRSIRPRAAATRCSCPTSPPSRCSTRCAACRASAMPRCSAPLDYSMRIWLNLDRMSSLDITRRRRGQGRPGAERAGRGRPGRRRAADRRRRLPAQHHHPGPPDHGRGVRGHRGARHARRRAGAHQGHRPRRARRQDQRFGSAATTASPRPASRSTSCPAPMRWPPPRRAQGAQGPGAALPRRCRLRRHVRHHGVRRGHDRERDPHADRGLRAGRPSSSSSSSATCAPRSFPSSPCRWR